MALFTKNSEALKTRKGSTHSVIKPSKSSLNRTITWPLIPVLALLFPVAVAHGLSAVQELSSRGEVMHMGSRGFH
jgi:hypothetical protein